MYSYCNNNPVRRVDSSGQAWETVFDLISLGSSIADVALNPCDPWAWVGLAGDIIDVVVPFIGGVGEAAKAMGVIVDAAQYADDTITAAKVTENTLEAVKEAAKALPPGNNTVYVSYAEGLIEYVGITNDFNRRKNEWEGIRDIIELVPGVDRAGARYVEQTVITIFGMSKNGGMLSNKINSIGVKGSKYADYVEFFVSLLN